MADPLTGQHPLQGCLSAVQEQGGNEAALAHCRASVALSMLLVLKDYLKKAYSLSTERTASFGPSGEGFWLPNVFVAKQVHFDWIT